jgi:hypothetical protein
VSLYILRFGFRKEAIERHGNDVVASFQGNPDPFIDKPKPVLVICAIGGDCGSFYTVTRCRVVDTRNPEGGRPMAGRP